MKVSYKEKSNRMNKAILFLILFTALNNSSIAQTNPEVIIPPHNDVYSEFVKKLEAGETNIDYRRFRESFIESKQFKMKGRSDYDSLKKAVHREMKNKNYPEIIKTTKSMLSIDYTSMFAHKILQQTYKILGDTVNKNKYHDIEFGLLKSILNSGDGKSCATARHVIQIEEEYFILDMIGAKLIKQSIENDGGLCDKMKVKTDKGKKTYYFEVTKVFEGYKKFK